MGELAEAGCVAFSQADRPLVDTQVLMRAMQYARDLRPSGVAAPAGRVPRARRRRARRRGGDATRPRRQFPRSRRRSRLSTILALVRATGVRVHLCRLSSAEGVAMVRAAKTRRSDVTADVGIHHLHLCDVDIGWFDSQAHLVPPLRGTRDRDALRAGVADGTIDVVCSDHAPGRRRREAAPVRRGGAGRDRPRAAAAADAQVGSRGARPASRRASAQ